MPLASLAALFALTILAAGPAAADGDVAKAKLPATTIDVNGSSDDDIPANAPKDDYGFVAWCFGAMDESISVYRQVIPELQAIDARIGSPVKEDVPYADDVADERLALKRFAGAMEAAERASPRPIAAEGAAAMQQGRAMWAQVRQQPPRQLAHAWLQWVFARPLRGLSRKTWKNRATLLDQAGWRLARRRWIARLQRLMRRRLRSLIPPAPRLGAAIRPRCRLPKGSAPPQTSPNTPGC